MVSLEDEEIPKKEAVNYILENEAAEEAKKLSEEEVSVVFCLDISGSMCVTTEIDGKHKVKGDNNSDLMEMMKFSDGSDQFFSGQKRNTTFVSRLQCVQAAIDS